MNEEGITNLNAEVKFLSCTIARQKYYLISLEIQTNNKNHLKSFNQDSTSYTG